MLIDQPLGSTDALAKRIVRPASQDDLRTAAEIYAVNEMAMRQRMHLLTRLAETKEETQAIAALADLQTLLAEDPRQVWIAEMAGEIIGVAAAAFREPHAHIQYVFVVPSAQERGVGGELLRELRDAGTAAGCTLFSLRATDDPRALTLYLRLGLRPQSPSVVWRADDPMFPKPNFANPLESTRLHVDDDATLNTIGDIDKAVRGVRRKRDIARWLREGAIGSLLLHRGSGKPAGYFLIAVDGPDGRIGPVAAMDEGEFGNVFGNALAATANWHEVGTTWEVAVPGENHAVIDPLLAARFRPTYATTFFTSRPIGRFDRYAFHDLDLL